MICKVPLKFEEGFKNIRNISKNHNSSLYSEKDFKIICDTIENIFGVKVITERYNEKIKLHHPVISKNDEFIEYDEYGNENLGFYKKYRLDGILTFDYHLKRFIIFQFNDFLVEKEIGWDLIYGIMEFNNFNHNNFGLNTQEINVELTKLVIIYRKSHYTQLLPLLDPHHFSLNNRIIELWNFDKLNNNNHFIRKFDIEFKNIVWTNEEITENEFLKIFGVDNNSKYKLDIFKEYLKFKFSNIQFICSVNELKVDKVIESIYIENDIAPNERFGSYTHQFYGGYRTDEISYLKFYLQKNKDNFDSNSVKYEDSDLDYRNYIESYFLVETDIVEYEDKISEKYFYHKLIYNIDFQNNNIFIQLEFNDKIMIKNIEKIKISELTSFKEIENYINSFHEITRIN
jgi:hypothetical protein